MFYYSFKFRLVKFKNLKLAYNDRKKLLYSDNEVILFKNFSRFYFDEILEVATDGPIFHKFFKAYNSIKVAKDINNPSYMILNSKIDYIC